MMTVEENRKRIQKNNLLTGLLFLITAIAVIGAVYYYNGLKSSKLSLQKSNHDLDSAYASLGEQKRNIEILLDTIAKYQEMIVALSPIQSPHDSISLLQNKINILLNPVTKDRDAAREFARSGYDKLAQKDLVGAMNDFAKSEKAYNGYHDSYEVYFLLHQNKDKLNDPEVKQQLLNQIQKKYNSLKRLTPDNIK